MVGEFGRLGIGETPKAFDRYDWGMPKIHVDAETVERLDRLRVEDESYDEIINELINIYQAEELTLFRAGDA